MLAIIALIVVFSFPAYAVDKKVKVYLGEKGELTEVESIVYEIDGEKKTVEVDGESSDITPLAVELPLSSKIVGVNADGEYYSYGGGKISDKSSFVLYKNAFTKVYTSIKNGIYMTLIKESRWKMFANGLLVTLEITFGALLIGIFLGFIVAAIRSTYDKTGKPKFLNSICNLYLTIIRGTPVVVQLMIMYFVVFSTIRNGVLAAIIAFGINSGAYVAEIIRSGIMSIDNGQMEAGRSLGLNYMQTMIYIICPQAFKNILPALGNEMIALVKETSVAGYVALNDITKAGDAVRSLTYSAFFPLIIVALIYLAIVLGLSKLLKILERRLRNSEH